MLRTVHIFFFMFLAFNVFCQQNEYNKTVWTVAWSPNGKYIASGGNQDELKLFDGNTYKLIKTYPVKDVQLSRLKWHPTKNKLAVITQGRTFKAKILDLDNDSWTGLRGLKNSFRALGWNYTGELLAVSELESFVSIYNIDGTRVSRFRADEKGVAGLDWHPKNNTLVTVGTKVGFFNYLGDTLKIFETRKKEPFLLCVEWHRSGKFFAVGDYGDLEKAKNKLVQFWNIEGEKIKEIKGSIAEYRNLRWNKKGTKLATASDALRIWSKKGKLLFESKSTNDYLWGIDWSPDGKYIITSSRKGVITIWNKKANKIAELEY
ncbi:hypothetical protein BFR04_04555 [Gaetbulibacter sp. 4G1]|nr:WD40 repeat domain-containing protein [Gaetbulibacter sp. 4G1]PIA78809.1 hypothetical protein BFR04_04555 [Gaetbulibacter sp. 4G1]